MLCKSNCAKSWRVARRTSHANRPSHQNYLNLVRGDQVRVVTFMACISSVSSLFTFLFGPVVGSVSDSLGRKPVLVLTQLLMAACWFNRNALAYPSIDVAMPCVLVARFLNGLCRESYFATRTAALSDAHSGRRLALAHSYISGSMGIAYLVGPLALTPLVGRSVARAFRVRWVCAVFSALLLYLGMEETNTAVRAAAAPPSGAVQDGDADEASPPVPKAIKAKRGVDIANPLSFLSLFRRRRSLAWFALAQAMQKMADPLKSLDSVCTFQVKQVLQLTPVEYGRTLTAQAWASCSARRSRGSCCRGWATSPLSCSATSAPRR